ncbi:Isocitrate dehydrogenase [NAD] subunit gamma, mitochondrial [Trichoplax sp. H2]|nr:Isocitrate dehydrogenase [NAD] subunit gamma, mitochondrial [Trichoplax sp. H2]|eukprot:RDD46775.1 Isocitrate dehydrogenase [NAD] subunit gamma, mitochondrial [Trichoplax sp. H2]
MASACNIWKTVNLYKHKGLHMQFYPIGHRLLSSSKANYAFSQYGGRYTVTLIPGDGIGPEMARHVKTVLHKCGAPIDFEVIDIKDESSTDAAIISLKRNGIGLKGTITTNISNPQSQSINAQIRRKLDLYSNIVPCKSIPGVWTRHGQVDLVVIRENTEGEYGSLEHENVDGVVESLKIITEKKSRRIAKFAFDYALQNNRRKVTAIHKANIMKLADGLFLETCREISKDYTDIEFESMIIDNCCMQGARNIGSDLVGLNRANPCGFLFTSALMLRHLGLDDYADIIESAVRTTIKNGKCRTPDIQGDRTTADFIDAVIKEIDVQ